MPQFGGGIDNIQFLSCDSPGIGLQLRENQAAIVNATIWIEKVTDEQNRYSFGQLQHAQMVPLDFTIFHLTDKTPLPPGE
jgi:hypothetical protein